MRRAFFLFLMSLLLLVPQYALAGSASTDKSVKKVEVTAVRWSVHHDDDDNDRLRLVLDMSNPVSVNAATSNTPTPRLVVAIKGALPGAIIDKSTDFDGSIINKISFAASGSDTTMSIELPEAISANDYRVFTLKEDATTNKPFRIVIDINKTAVSANYSFQPGLKGKVIGIDPGHGGSDAGAIGLNGTTEKAVNLAVAMQVKALLEKAGAKVVMTRTDDRDVYGRYASDVDELQARASVANDNNVDIFISIHSNAIGNRDVGGTATYYYPKTKYDSLLAQSIQANIIKTGLDDRGTNSARFYVLRRSKMPAALVEMAFISNPKEESLLGSPAFQQQMAQGIVKGLDTFFVQASK